MTPRLKQSINSKLYQGLNNLESMIKWESKVTLIKEMSDWNFLDSRIKNVDFELKFAILK